MPKPSLGRIVHHRSARGLQTMRAAVVTATASTLDPRGVEAETVPALTDDEHVHLWVYSPSPENLHGGFAEFNVPRGHGDEAGTDIPPGSWTWPVIVKEN